MKKSDLHWLAGIIDKGCSLSCVKATRKKNDHYALRLVISSTNLELLDRIQKLVGIGYVGTISKKNITQNHGVNPRYSNIKTRYQLVFCGEQVAQLLTLVYPYLRTRTRQVHIALSLQHKIERARYTNQGMRYVQDTSAIESMRHNISALGVRPLQYTS